MELKPKKIKSGKSPIKFPGKDPVHKSGKDPVHKSGKTTVQKFHPLFIGFKFSQFTKFIIIC